MPFIFFAALALTIPSVQPDVPNKQPSIAGNSRVLDVVFGSRTSIWLTSSKDGGQTFSPPSEVANVPALALGRHRGPRVAISGSSIVVTAVYGSGIASGPHSHGVPEDGNLVAWRSGDQGKSWSKPVVINDVPAAAREGLHAMAAGSDGELAVVWLDLRAKGTRLMGAFSSDGGASWSKNVLVYQAVGSAPGEETICQCCHPSLVALQGKQYAVMFRNVVNGSRDMYSLVWNPHTSPGHAIKMGSGSWAINACPMDGGGIASDGRKLVSAWRREETVYLADNEGHEQALGQGKNVALAMARNGPYVAWSNSQGVQLKLPNAAESVTVASTGDFPALTALSHGGVAVAWEENGQMRIRIFK